MKNVFIAHQSGIHETRLLALKEEIREAMLPLLPPGEQVNLVLGKEDYDRNFAVCGSWEAWGANVAEGVTADLYGTGPRYNAFVVPGEQVGKATASILARAIYLGKAVYSFRGGQFFPVARVVRHDPEDNRSGWAVE